MQYTKCVCDVQFTSVHGTRVNCAYSSPLVSLQRNEACVFVCLCVCSVCNSLWFCMLCRLKSLELTKPTNAIFSGIWISIKWWKGFRHMVRMHLNNERIAHVNGNISLFLFSLHFVDGDYGSPKRCPLYGQCRFCCEWRYFCDLCT